MVAAAQPGDMILTLGAGSVSQLGPMILAKLAGTDAIASVASVCRNTTDLPGPASPAPSETCDHKTAVADNDFSPRPSNLDKGSDMASEKAMYWLAVGVLAFGVANGFVNDTGMARSPADGSIIDGTAGL